MSPRTVGLNFFLEIVGLSVRFTNKATLGKLNLSLTVNPVYS